MKTLKSNMLCGFNLTMVGDERAYSYTSSRKADTIADDAIKASLISLPNVKMYSFLNRYSDERQYCSPGVDLPLCSFSRSREYPEYHTNKDDFSVVTQKGLQGSFNVIKKIIDAMELGLYPKVMTYGEPNLGKRGLYPTISQKGNSNAIKTRMNLISQCDGLTNIFKITKLLNKPLDQICSEFSLLKSKKILK